MQISELGDALISVGLSLAFFGFLFVLFLRFFTTTETIDTKNKEVHNGK